VRNVTFIFESSQNKKAKEKKDHVPRFPHQIEPMSVSDIPENNLSL